MSVGTVQQKRNIGPDSSPLPKSSQSFINLIIPHPPNPTTKTIKTIKMDSKKSLPDILFDIRLNKRFIIIGLG